MSSCYLLLFPQHLQPKRRQLFGLSSGCPTLIFKRLFWDGWNNTGIYEMYWPSQEEPAIRGLSLEILVHTRICTWSQAPQCKRRLTSDWTGWEFKTGCLHSRQMKEGCETVSLFPRKIYKLCMKDLGGTLFSIYHIQVSVASAQREQVGMMCSVTNCNAFPPHF